MPNDAKSQIRRLAAILGRIKDMGLEAISIADPVSLDVEAAEYEADSGVLQDQCRSTSRWPPKRCR